MQFEWWMLMVIAQSLATECARHRMITISKRKTDEIKKRRSNEQHVFDKDEGRQVVAFENFLGSTKLNNRILSNYENL
jgi:low affinity Fe/Cu permease